jgi:hypothetical protein
MAKKSKEDREKNRIALGGLEGGRFDEAVIKLRRDLRQLREFVADSCEAINVADGKMVSLGHEVERDVLVVTHIEAKLMEAFSQLVSLLTLARAAAASLEAANRN